MCPSCLSIDSDYIYDAKINNTDESRPLHECNQCGNFFLYDSGEKVQLLSQLCKTRWINRKMCNKEVLTLFPKLLFKNSMNMEELDKYVVSVLIRNLFCQQYIDKFRSMKPQETKILTMKRRLYAMPSLSPVSLSSKSLFSQSFFSPGKLREGWILK
jgi:hypothetical protein